jgi:hypothetical protein
MAFSIDASCLHHSSHNGVRRIDKNKKTEGGKKMEYIGHHHLSFVAADGFSFTVAYRDGEGMLHTVGHGNSGNHTAGMAGDGVNYQSLGEQIPKEIRNLIPQKTLPEFPDFKLGRDSKGCPQMSIASERRPIHKGDVGHEWYRELQRYLSFAEIPWQDTVWPGK